MTCRPADATKAEGFANGLLGGAANLHLTLSWSLKTTCLGGFVLKANSELLICWSFFGKQYRCLRECTGSEGVQESGVLLQVVSRHFVFTA